MNCIRSQILLKVFQTEYPNGQIYIRDRLKTFDLEKTDREQIDRILIKEIENLLYFSSNRSQYERAINDLIAQKEADQLNLSYKSTFIKGK